ncbi:O-linked N-acetylglucosamine transferase, SPINDLY family protein [Hydrocoleum sp. CS-953]|uniref:O-linked N-acetylglucosamine transferase, SPINDLY family protein n=1 Tax=Hydrocoleum sp. CS-953 TaxID=1671698 RepID=UPI000B9C7340|nr:O-linked N-acetylglucosamine transferase, SPINDLY family protein [Hydrocoleum sp. CS-953]OZH52234.1 O-linked N-acetylglucosamine transferase, SPINDLY family protein [Hydrocoleum sp. CS-953]
MLPKDTPSNLTSWQQEADIYWKKGNYTKAANLYEQAINTQSNCKSYYWQLGLILLLQGKEEEAQTTWLLGIADGEVEEVEQWTEELVQVLTTEANRQAAKEDYAVAWTIRQHIREIHPTDIHNLLHLIYLSIGIENYTAEQLNEYEIITQLKNSKVEELDQNLLLHLLNKLLVHDPINLSSIEFVSVAVQKIEDKLALVSCLIPPIYQIAYSFAELGVARKYTEILLNVVPENQEVLRTMAQFSTELTEYSLGLEYAQKSYALSKKIFEKVIDYHSVCRSLIALKGCDEKVQEAVEYQEKLLQSLVTESPQKLGGAAIRLYSSSFFFPYARDCAEKNIKIRSQVAELCQQNLEKANSQQINKYRHKLSQQKQINSTKKTLKIGYLSHCLRRHSVGWITRWLFTYHNRDKYEIYAYLQGAENRNDSLQQWYINQATKAHVYGIVGTEMAEDIYEDEIDILIDLDSITLTNSCSIMAMKAAPIQVTWLGWDASGIPTIDYYIADPYVLPENAQDYYPHKIWRLPQTYVAVDGFEVNIPSLKREDLGIPSDAVVYFTAQRGFKCNPDTARLQMKILKEVPNSYFLFKKFGESDILSELLIDIAESEGISSDRLIPIEEVAREEIHRANLGIADIVLDTYPYNGATTTLETLWMCIPMVTRVGQQFAARNSYTMMINAGITEGIAWSDEEYVEWGIRLGKDEKLRQEISWKLRKSKQTAPLWNAKQFTREMEKAYEQMWQRYIDN